MYFDLSEFAKELFHIGTAFGRPAIEEKDPLPGPVLIRPRRLSEIFAKAVTAPADG
jgi:hypothetical protein